jgi:hypothetical protein
VCSDEKRVHCPTVGIPPETREKPDFGLQTERNPKNVTKVLGVFEFDPFKRSANQIASAHSLFAAPFADERKTRALPRDSEGAGESVGVLQSRGVAAGDRGVHRVLQSPTASRRGRKCRSGEMDFGCACNHPNLLVLAFSLELIRAAAQRIFITFKMILRGERSASLSHSPWHRNIFSPASAPLNFDEGVNIRVSFCEASREPRKE